jgi:hypothetical protein
LPISIDQISALLWFDVYLIFIWNLFTWDWMGWRDKLVEREMERRRFSVLSRLNRFWTWPLVSLLDFHLQPDKPWVKIREVLSAS